MGWHLIHLHDVAESPWRNGGGVTRELVVFPVREHWHWRMSVAEVTQDGPFSRFEGVRRWFAVLSGAGVCLHCAGTPTRLEVTSDPFAFDGNEEVHCTLLSGPTRDFNLMVRQGRASMARVAGARAVAVSSGSAVALWAGEGGGRAVFEGHAVTLAPHSLAWRHLDLGGRVHLEAADGLWMEVAP